MDLLSLISHIYFVHLVNKPPYLSFDNISTIMAKWYSWSDWKVCQERFLFNIFCKTDKSFQVIFFYCTYVVMYQQIYPVGDWVEFRILFNTIEVISDNGNITCIQFKILWYNWRTIVMYQCWHVVFILKFFIKRLGILVCNSTFWSKVSSKARWYAADNTNFSVLVHYIYSALVSLGEHWSVVILIWWYHKS